MLFRVQAFLGPRFSGSRFFRVWVQGPGLGLSSSQRRDSDTGVLLQICEISKNTFFHRSPLVGYSKP